jgi:hypothetical protein
MTGIREAVAWGRRRLAGIRDTFTGVRYVAAEARGLRLLEQNLSPTQRRQYAASRTFEVIGGSTGRRYRIRHGQYMNVEELDETGRYVRAWCFYPAGDLPAGDVLLGQKLALELFEPDALTIANKREVSLVR